MCGIAGTYASNNRISSSRAASADLLLAMAGELAHRGPDGVGLYLDDGFGMVGTRLAIVDLVSGDQPLSNETGRLWVVQNGEIYNHPELRAELERLGHRFVTTCDTEVLVHAYEAWGCDCLRRLNGDFAFAIWDQASRELFLARDRFGVRPLFLAEHDGGLSFASEARALLRHPAARRELDPLALLDTFTLWSVLPDRSSFVGIRELPPAHYLRYGPRGLIEERRWWDLPFDDPTLVGRDADLAEELRVLLEDATRLRLRADVPVGAYLSGGLDSSSIAALVKRLSGQTRRSFCVGFESASHDESAFQDRMSRELEAELSRAMVSTGDIAAVFPRVVELAEKPLLRTAPAPMLLLSALVRREGFKVVLTGEGADELFGGYDIFKEARLRRFWAREPNSELRPRLFGRLRPYLDRNQEQGGAFLAHLYRQGLADTGDLLYSHRPRYATTSRAARFFTDDLLARAVAQGEPETRLLARLPSEFASFSGLGQAQYLEVQTFLSGYLLHAQGDRMLMGNSVEGRFPFLDYRVAEFAARLPDRLRLRGLQEKVLLHKAMDPLLPREIGARQKRPYRAPIAQAFLGPGAPEYVMELLEPRQLEEVGIFRPERVVRLLEKCRRYAGASMSEVEDMALVGVLSTMLLHERMVARPRLAPAAIATRIVGMPAAALEGIS